MTVEECVDFIDFGCEMFVARANGGRTAVHAVRKGARPYIATDPDLSGANNLHSLPILTRAS